MSKRSGVDIETKVYGGFKGCDFTTDPSMVDNQRSPYAVNMISDEGGNPEKRPGYQRIYNGSSPIKGLYQFKCDHNELLGIVYQKDGSVVTYPAVTVSEEIYDKTGVYGLTTVTFNWTTLSTSSYYTLTVACGSYSYSTTCEGESALDEELADFGIVIGETKGDTNTITFTTSRAKLKDKHFLAHIANRIYRWYEDGTTESVYFIYDSEKSEAVVLNKKLYIFTGVKLLVYDGNTVTAAEDNAYIPLTVISRVPGSTPGGVTYEGINYLTGKQKVSFKGDGTTAAYHLPYTDATGVIVWVDDVKKTSGTHYNYSSGVVTFTSGNIPAAPLSGAADNVTIQFTEKFDGYADRINHCTTAIAWGVNGASDRIVCAGDDNFPNRDYVCGYNDGTYWPDTNYMVVGSTATKIMGYRRYGSSLMVVKEDNGQDSTVFSRTVSLDDDGEAVFATYPCLAGVGGVSERGFGNIDDDQLILTSNGVYAITNNTITAEEIAEMRSKYIDAKLKKEAMREAVCCSFRKMFMIFFPNGHGYILDGRQAKSYSSRNETTYNYEGYYWENVPASCAMVDVEEGVEQLYFGTETGKIYKFLWDEEQMLKYSDGGYYSGETWVNGDAISAVWSTKSDDDGDPMVLKTMLKKGNAVTFKPFARSSAKVCVRTDKDVVDWQTNQGNMDIFDWENIDFLRFTFDANDAPREVTFNRKVKNYKRLQMIMKNNSVNEGFGVYKVVKHYVCGNFAKR